MKPASKNNPAPRPQSTTVAESERAVAAPNDIVRRHLKIGWWALLIFLTLGIVLESLHGFKIGFYLNVSNTTRRLMWTLAHAHGTLLALVNLAFAGTFSMLSLAPKSARLVSNLLFGATILMPTGFFLGGLVIYAGDPGFGILLLPLGAVFLLAAVFIIARASRN